MANNTTMNGTPTTLAVDMKRNRKTITNSIMNKRVNGWDLLILTSDLLRSHFLRTIAIT